MKNRFEATCVACRGVVAAGQGDTNLRDGRWITKHTNFCPSVPYSNNPQTNAEELYDITGMTDADWRDACNPDEGDQ